MNKPPTTKSEISLQSWLAFAAGLSAAAVYGAAWTILNAVLPQMQGDLSASLDQVSWAVTATAVASAIGIPPTASLAARLGLKRLLISSLTLFTIATFLLCFAETLETLVVLRILQALSGAPLITLSQSITLHVFPLDRRGLGLSLWSLGLAAGWVFAPAVGAYLADLYSWRAIFAVLTPLALLATMGCMAFVPKSEPEIARRFDWFGFVAISIGIGALQVLINRGQRADWFDSPEMVGCALVAGFALYIFVAHSMTTKLQFIRWAVFRNRNFVVGLSITLIYAYVGLVPLVMIPTMLEDIRGLDVLMIGLLTIPRGLSQMVGMPLAGYFVHRVDARWLIGGGLIVFIYGSWTMAHYNLDIGVWDIVWPSVIQGVALSFVWIPTMNVMYSNIAPELRTDAASLVSFTYSLASGLAVALSVSVLIRSSQVSHEELAARITPTNETLRFPAYEGFWDFDTLTAIASMDAELTQQSYMIGYANVYWLILVTAVAALPLVLLIKRVPRA